ncbi:CHAT domain-containing protein [Streptomyces sp. NRRL F-4474]|uniref:CHAT domain-containing protein n=1 Tax=Streptomyces sp. NRRL F-4474 TaxID=1463851 RepID=UPI0004CB6B0E|nr:CHAT domain-containing protein [Streptomyces sp. NRRL F-4474]
MGTWRRRLASMAVTAVRRHLEVDLLADLQGLDATDVRAITRLYQVLDRRPVYSDALDHIVQSVDQHYSRAAPKPLVRRLLASLLDETGAHFQELGRAQEAAQCHRIATELAPDGPDRTILHLLSAIHSEQQLHTLGSHTVDAVLRALLHEVGRSGRKIRRARILAAVAYAAHSTANFERLRTAVEPLAAAADTPGYQALATFYRSRLLLAGGRLAEARALEREFSRTAARVGPKDRAHEMVASALESLTPDGGAMDQAAEAARRGDHVGAAGWYGQCAEELPAGPFRATMRLFAEAARVQGGLLPSPAAVRQCLSRLCADNVFAARTITDVESLLTGLLMRAVDLHQAGADAQIVAEVADFLGEFRGGTAVGRPQGSGAYDTDARADMTLVDFLAQATTPVTAAEIVTGLPAHHVVWVHVTGQTGEHHLTVVTLRPSDPVPLVRRTHLSTADGKALAQCLDEDSEDAPAEAVRRISDLFFADIGPDALGTRILVVPDSATWAMPWNELAPRGTAALAISMSAAAALRSRPARAAVVPRVIGIFDEVELEGSRLEARALDRLDAQGHIRFTRVHSLAELRDALETAPYDILTISVHGTESDGFEYRMLLPDGPSSPAALLRLGLPEVVVLGCCWSAKSTERADTTAAALSCLAAGASQVVGGLWAIDDELAGRLLADTYDRHLRRGVPLPQALRQAHLALPPDLRPGAAGLALIGRG